MGRAIDMEKDIDALKIKVEKLDNTVRGMVSKLDETDEKAVKTKHIDLVEDVKSETKDDGSFENIGSTMTGVYKDEKEKADNEGNNKSGKQSNNKRRKSSKKSV